MAAGSLEDGEPAEALLGQHASGGRLGGAKVGEVVLGGDAGGGSGG